MPNEREESAWYLHANQMSATPVEPDDAVVAAVNDGTVSWSCNAYTKDDHEANGANRKFDASLVDTIDDVYRCNWDLPEYIPFRECIKMGIQDGIKAGIKRASDEHKRLIDDKNRRIAELEDDANRWKNAFTGLLGKCREGIEALDFISSVVHGSSGKKY